MAVPNYVSRSIALFGGKLTTVYDSAANEAAGLDYGSSFTSFGVGNSVDGHDSGDGTTTHVWSTTIAVAPAATITIAAGVVVAVSGGQNSPAVAAGSLSISGIISITLDLSQAHPLATIVYSEACYAVDNYSNVVFSTAAGVGYLCDGAVTGANTTTHTVEVHIQGSGTAGSASFGNNQIARTSDDVSNLPTDFALTVIPAPAPSGGARKTVLKAAKLLIGL